MARTLTRYVLPEATYDMTDNGVATPNHRHFSFVGDRPSQDVVRRLALQLANHYLQRDASRTAWRRIAPEVVRWRREVRDVASVSGETPQPTPPSRYIERTSQVLHLHDFDNHLSQAATFDFESMGLFDPMCRWLDSHLKISPRFLAAANGENHALTFYVESNLGPRFPITAAVDREGMVVTSFQLSLISRIAELREWLVEHSQQPDSDEWFLALRNVISECISLLDNTVHQIYLKAQFDPEPGWRFDTDALGVRHGRKLTDKIGWVHGITGRHLDAHDELRDMNTIRVLRNHLQHFDPPNFACTWEEVAEWLNAIVGVAGLAWRIRDRVGALPCVPLIRLLLQRQVAFVPPNPTRRRVRRSPLVGYPSTSAERLDNGATFPVRADGVMMRAPHAPELLPRLE